MFISVKTCIHTYALIYVDTLTCVCVYLCLYVSCVLKLTITYLISDVDAIFSKLSELRAQKEREKFSRQFLQSKIMHVFQIPQAHPHIQPYMCVQKYYLFYLSSRQTKVLKANRFIIYSLCQFRLATIDFMERNTTNA